MVEEVRLDPTVLESDRKIVILKLQKMAESRQETSVRVKEIQEMVNGIGLIKWNFGCREGNVATHAMAQVICD
ncbi:unnamed protein product [Linum trigynum]|uniref:RNase H type-1 domain-containing protein n=1 Tax=Linum trigynum TaxID=586398 RepID=A0AAV2FKC4_9ROSI